MLDFKKIKTAVAKQFNMMASNYPLFRTSATINSVIDPVGEDVIKNGMWETYLQSFPEGTNPIYKTNTEHDCTCCKQFIRSVGNVVAVIEGKIVSVWEVDVKEPEYQIVADKMAAFVKQHPIAKPFLHFEKTAGTDKTRDLTGAEVFSWEHFFVNIPSAYVMKGEEIDSAIGKKRANFDVMKRGLTELTSDALTTVLELCKQNAIYRGSEHLPAVQGFLEMKNKFDVAVARGQDADSWVWSNLTPKGMVRNTAIGTLLIDLSDGVELEPAVHKFETSIMAPSNYKRPTALVSKKMIEDAKVKINLLGLSSALERRYATIEDITVQNILYANRNARRSMKADVFDDLASGVSEKKSLKMKYEDVPIADFINNILPSAKSVELLVENRHSGNLVSLIAPVDPTAKKMFKWDNGFSWSYNGDVTDSIKERVKAAGGSVEGDLCCRLAWEYTDDLDFHMHEPSGDHIYFGVRRRLSSCGGMLDLDANGADGPVPNPAENIFYRNRNTMKEGIYTLFVNNYSRRSDGVGFEVEIEFDGTKHNMVYERVLRNQESVEVAQIKYSKSEGFQIVKSLPASQSSKTIWNVKTQTFQPVNVVMLSPNYWDEQSGTGNKHLFFMLEECRNDGQARGFYNEFLTDELSANRKVLEMVGSKMRTEESDRQLSGLGFSSTQRNSVVCRVTGSFSRVINLVF